MKNDLNLCETVCALTSWQAQVPFVERGDLLFLFFFLKTEHISHLALSLYLALILLPSSPGPNYPTIHIYMLK